MESTPLCSFVTQLAPHSPSFFFAFFSCSTKTEEEPFFCASKHRLRACVFVVVYKIIISLHTEQENL